MSKKKKPDTKSKKIQRIVTLVLGLGFGGSMLAIALGGVFSQNHSTASYSEDGNSPSMEEQIQMQTDGYTRVLEREPKNQTAIQGLMQIAQLHLQTGNAKEAIPVLEKIVKYSPEQTEIAQVLAGLKEQEANKPVATDKDPTATSEAEKPESP